MMEFTEHTRLLAYPLAPHRTAYAWGQSVTQALDWDELAAAHSVPLVERLRGHIARGGRLEISATELSMESRAPADQAAALLAAVAADGALTVSSRWRCPCEARCILSQTDLENECCPRTGKAFSADIDGMPVEETVYVRDARQTRDVRWVLALHGMNTRGAWQEEFAWMASRTYGHSVPVAIYKYGVVRPGAGLRFHQRLLTAELQVCIRRLSGETAEAGFGGTPDVIAHSFGTWLLGHALQADPELRVGRVILTGCILRPDFSWAELIARRQVEAVLCHYATRDFWARVAHYVIPDSGPSGRVGFNDRKHIVHKELPSGRHSDFFAEDKLGSFFEKAWQPFLTEPGNQIPAGDSSESTWTEAWWLFRARLWRWLILLAAGTLAVLALAAMALGLLDLASFL